MRCQSCGAPIPENRGSCQYCGTVPEGFGSSTINVVGSSAASPLNPLGNRILHFEQYDANKSYDLFDCVIIDGHTHVCTNRSGVFQKIVPIR